MTSALIVNGHLSWPLFAVLVFTGLTVLGVDIVWRRVTMSARRLALAAACVWLVGLLLILVVS